MDQFRSVRTATAPVDRQTCVHVIDAHWAADAIDQERWMDLAQNAVVPNPFFEPWFLLPSLRSFGMRRGIEVISLQSGPTMLGLLPVARRFSYERYPLPHRASWLHPNMFCGTPLIRKGYESLFWHAVFDWLDANAGNALFFHLHCLPTDGPVFAALRSVTSEQGRCAAVVERSERAMLQADLDPDSYFSASLSAKKRKELRRQYKRLSELGQVSFERVEGEAGLDRWIKAYLALEQAGWKGRKGTAMGLGKNPGRFFTDTLAGAAARGRLERLSLNLDGRPVAMLANFLTPPGAYAFKTTFDETLARHSPGVLLQRENLALLARDDIAWTDSCAASGHPMIEHIWRERREIARVSIAIGGTARRSLARQILRAETGAPVEGL